jgi:hypothetical protein
MTTSNSFQHRIVSALSEEGENLYQVNVDRSCPQRASFPVYAESVEDAQRKVYANLSQDYWKPFLHWENEPVPYSVTSCELEYTAIMLSDENGDDLPGDLGYFDDIDTGAITNCEEVEKFERLADGVYRIENGVVVRRLGNGTA